MPPAYSSFLIKYYILVIINNNCNTPFFNIASLARKHQKRKTEKTLNVVKFQIYYLFIKFSVFT